MATTSRFRVLRAALKTAVVAQLVTDGTTSVDVFAYQPTGNVTREDMVWFGRITVEQDGLTMGGTGRQVGETISVDVSVRAPVVGADQDDAAVAETRAETIFKSVENALRNDPDVASTVMFTEVDGFESVPDYDESGAVGTIEATIVGMSNV